MYIPTTMLLLSIILLLHFTTINALEKRKLTIFNKSNHRIDISWINPQTRQLVLQSHPDVVLPGASFTLQSFVSHSFMVRELPGDDEELGECEGGECRVDYFTVGDSRDQVILIKEGMKVEHTDSKSIAVKSTNDVLTECKSTADQALKSNNNLNNDNTFDIIHNLTTCIQSSIVSDIERAHEELSFQSQLRKNMAAQLENYTCADELLDTTTAKRSETWDGRRVNILLDRAASKIHTIQDFVTQEECQAVEEAAEPLLQDATVADGKGGMHKSDYRKAQQAPIKVDWENESEGDLIARLSRRVYDYVNHVLPFDIQKEGQQDLMAIQYFGRGPGDEKPDRYLPHCDGDCNGRLFRMGTRMATIVVYCEIPKVGGATRFRNSNVHIRPKKYAATFFSYIDPYTMEMDDGFTEHSGCPVVEGEKKIVTQWVRLGVDEENPWSSFNSLGVRHSDVENQ